MVKLMGGKDSIGFKHFCALTIKSFLACRPYGQAVVDTSSLMLAAEFPSFKGEPTMDRLRERFQLQLTEKEAAAYMMGVINNAFENPRSIVYDEFQVSCRFYRFRSKLILFSSTCKMLFLMLDDYDEFEYCNDNRFVQLSQQREKKFSNFSKLRLYMVRFC